MTETTFSLPIKISGETREVEFLRWSDAHVEAYSTAPVGIFSKGPGKKQWKNKLRVVFVNGAWQLDQSAVILNCNGYRVRGWADAIRNESQHNSAR